ncbi:MAG: MmcB family DNA repair protein [Maricaulaceae bacterium]
MGAAVLPLFPRNPRLDDARQIARGAARVMLHHGFSPIQEFALPNQQRADLAGLAPGGDVMIVEVKSGLADLRADQKWRGYLDYADLFYFAVSERFPLNALPAEAGIIVADGFDGAIVREATRFALAPARRTALTRRFARAAAERLARATALTPDAQR